MDADILLAPGPAKGMSKRGADTVSPINNGRALAFLPVSIRRRQATDGVWSGRQPVQIFTAARLPASYYIRFFRRVRYILCAVAQARTLAYTVTPSNYRRRLPANNCRQHGFFGGVTPAAPDATPARHRLHFAPLS